MHGFAELDAIPRILYPEASCLAWITFEHSNHLKAADCLGASDSLNWPFLSARNVLCAWMVASNWESQPCSQLFKQAVRILQISGGSLEDSGLDIDQPYLQVVDCVRFGDSVSEGCRSEARTQRRYAYLIIHLLLTAAACRYIDCSRLQVLQVLYMSRRGFTICCQGIVLVQAR